MPGKSTAHGGFAAIRRTGSFFRRPDDIPDAESHPQCPGLSKLLSESWCFSPGIPAVSAPSKLITLPSLVSLFCTKLVVRKAYGGIVIDAAGRVLLREPTDHYKGHVWTFAKGKPEPGEAPHETALREVFEETGVRARIVLKIPGSFDGSTTSNEYFLMSPVEDTGHYDGETLRTAWVTRKEARELILLTIKPRRRRRDLRVLKLAFRLFNTFETVGPADAPAQTPGAARPQITSSPDSDLSSSR